MCSRPFLSVYIFPLFEVMCVDALLQRKSSICPRYVTLCDSDWMPCREINWVCVIVLIDFKESDDVDDVEDVEDVGLSP